MIKTIIPPRIAARLAAHLGGPMTAGIEEYANVAVAVAGEDDGPATDGAGLKIPGFADFRFVAAIYPGAVEHGAAFRLQHCRIGQRPPVQPEDQVLRSIDDIGRIGRHNRSAISQTNSIWGAL